MKSGNEGTTRETPKVEIIEDEDRWDAFTPRALRHKPRQLQVVLGKNAPHRREGVTVTIAEMDWEHTELYIGLKVETKKEKFSLEGVARVGQIDQIIYCLTLARDEAAKLGFLTSRPTPTAADAPILAEMQKVG